MIRRLIETVTGRGFTTRLRQIHCETRWPLVHQGANAGAFVIVHRATRYEVWAVPDGAAVTLSLLSNAPFALAHYPPVLQHVLRRRNRDLDTFAWALLDACQVTRARLTCSIDREAWDGAATRYAVARMLPEVHRYDTGLRAKGLMSSQNPVERYR